MNYRPTAAGHAARDAPREVEQEAIDEELIERASEWLEGSDGLYTSALEATKGLWTTQKTAGLLGMHPILRQHDRYWRLGNFLSALYNHCIPEHIIIYPHDTPDLTYLGRELPEEKALFITGRAGSFAAMEAEGPVFITKRAGEKFGWYAMGPLFMQENGAAWPAKRARGPVILRSSTNISQYCGTLITPAQYEKNIPLRTYIDAMLELAKNNPAAIEETFIDGKTITATINKLVGGVK